MKIYQYCKRNPPSTNCGESITVTTIYYSFKKDEIDEIQKQMPTGMLVMDTGNPESKNVIMDEELT